jgi:nucleotide-binding universal stress UspA family protein
MRLAGASGEDIERYRQDEFSRAERQMQKQMQDLEANSAIGKLLLHGYPAVVLLRQIERTGADLLVIGKHGGTSLDERLLGSVTHNVLYQAGCNVLLVP